jgi:hypothetical protein
MSRLCGTLADGRVAVDEDQRHDEVGMVAVELKYDGPPQDRPAACAGPSSSAAISAARQRA